MSTLKTKFRRVERQLLLNRFQGTRHEATALGLVQAAEFAKLDAQLALEAHKRGGEL